MPTGSAHWESLLRARAIETQCYVIAAAQTGTHNKKRASFGHAMVVDPWGAIVAQCSDGIGMAVAQIDLNFRHSVRQKLPVWTDRRPELYGDIIAAQARPELTLGEEPFQFGPTAVVHSSQIFYRSKHSIAFVNHRPLLAGHVLVASLRPVKRLKDLNTEEVTDLFCLVQRVQKAIETEFGANASTVAVQDGLDAGQSIEHLHVHLLPRKPSDFDGKIDQIYVELQKHDKTEHNSKYKLRTDQEMSEESNRLKKYF